MKAINENLVNKNRTKLEEVLPLKTPYKIVIDPCNLCNFKCEFCAIQTTEKKLNYKKQFMSYELFKKGIDDIKKFPDKLKILPITGIGEPLLNKDFCRMVRYAKEKQISDFIETITNGSKLNPKLNQELVDSGIDRIRISIEAIDTDGYNKLAKFNIDYDEFIYNIKDLYERSKGKCEIYIKTVNVAVPTESDRKKFYKIFGNICDKIFIDNVIPLWSDFEDINNKFEFKKDIGIHGQHVEKLKVCPFPFYSFIINPDGEITVCCADWQRKLVLGNVTNESLLNIWNSEKLKEFLIDMLKGQKHNYKMCQKCILPMYDCNDNIDDYRKDLLRKMLLNDK